MSITHIGQELVIIVRSQIGANNFRAAKEAGFTLTHVLEDLPVLSVSQACNLHIERDTIDGTFRVWLSRCGLADGEPFENTVYLEESDREEGRWKDVAYFDGDTLLSDLAKGQA